MVTGSDSLSASNCAVCIVASAESSCQDTKEESWKTY